MDIIKIIGIGIVGVFLSITVKAYRKDFGLYTTLITAIIILFYTLPKIQEIIKGFNSIAESSGIDSNYIKAIIKMLGIAYITEFASELSKDADEGLLSKKIELAGKVSLLLVTMPIVKSLLTTIIAILADF